MSQPEKEERRASFAYLVCELYLNCLIMFLALLWQVSAVRSRHVQASQHGATECGAGAGRLRRAHTGSQGVHERITLSRHHLRRQVENNVLSCLSVKMLYFYISFAPTI